ncbi:MAG: T9SS type A sorting domain-containing protein [Carboxylicivirga sp.]|jgi:hypothetical protein|nr:T9SS type A sorting domain-containing protein [Carboxylicivirga sp.]
MRKNKLFINVIATLAICCFCQVTKAQSENDFTPYADTHDNYVEVNFKKITNGNGWTFINGKYTKEELLTCLAFSNNAGFRVSSVETEKDGGTEADTYMSVVRRNASLEDQEALKIAFTGKSAHNVNNSKLKFGIAIGPNAICLTTADGGLVVSTGTNSYAVDVDPEAKIYLMVEKVSGLSYRWGLGDGNKAYCAEFTVSSDQMIAGGGTEEEAWAGMVLATEYSKTVTINDFGKGTVDASFFANATDLTDTPTAIRKEMKNIDQCYYNNEMLYFKSINIGRVKVFDLTGKCVFNQSVKSTAVPLTGLNKGVYIVVTENGTTKIVL